METSLIKSCLGSLYLANTEAIQTTCKFEVAEASEQIFELAENTFNHQHKLGIPGQEHNPDMPQQLKSTRLLHPDHGSHDLSGRIRNNRDPEDDHGLDARTG
jgi:hypothetical protein